MIAVFLGIYVLTAIGAYLLGSVPFGLVTARLFGLGDIRKIGSGNIGATNVLRTGNKPAALLTLIGDAAKGAVAVLIARSLFGDGAAGIAALFAMLGHLYSVFLGFKGGKGVATFLGTLLALSFPVGLAACATWAITAGISRISSLAGVTAAILAPVFTVVLYNHGAVPVAIMSALIVFKHRPNIVRIRNGTEPKIGRKS